MAKLGEVCKVSASTKMIDKSKAWLLNLDMVEQQTGRVVEYNFVGGDGLNGSITQFDTENVLYSKLRPNLNKVVLPERNGFCTSELLPLRPDARKLDRSYLAVFLRSDGFVNWAVSKTAGAKMPRLGTKDLLNANIPLPEIKEQKAIAEKFKKSEELISLRKQQLAKLDELVKVRFVEMFTANESNFPMTALNDLCKEIFAGGDKPSEMSQIQTDEFEFPVYANGYENLGLQGFAKNYRVEEKSVTISARGTIGYSFIREGKYTPIVRLITAVPGDKLNVVYLKYSIDMLDIKSSGTSQAQLTVPNFKKMKIMEPPLPLQNEFAAFVECVDQQKQTVQQSLEKLELMKKALMQEYFG